MSSVIEDRRPRVKEFRTNRHDGGRYWYRWSVGPYVLRVLDYENSGVPYVFLRSIIEVEEYPTRIETHMGDCYVTGERYGSQWEAVEAVVARGR